MSISVTCLQSKLEDFDRALSRYVVRFRRKVVSRQVDGFESLVGAKGCGDGFGSDGANTCICQAKIPATPIGEQRPWIGRGHR